MTITGLACEYGCSTSLIWRPLNFHTPPSNQRTAGICAEYTGGATLLALAGRWQCSMSGIRSVLARGGVVMRPKRSRRPVPDTQIIELRDRRRLAWAGISAATGLNVETLLVRYTEAQGRQPARECHRHPADSPT